MTESEGINEKMQAEVQAIHNLDMQWAEMVESKNASGMAALYTANALWLPPNDVQTSGTEAIQNFYTRLFQTPNLSLVHTTTKIAVSQSGEMAVEVGAYNISMDTPQGTFKDTGKYMFLLSKLDGEWRIAADIFNSDAPLM
ncbi:MAG TPA: ketosteroid isomerase [Cyanobacteria bacterium UBA11049]|nr:ketosteroid isomerase [Cyanobacteria bacterium UBA11049]